MRKVNIDAEMTALNDERKIPLVVGVTGHRDLVTEDLPALKAAVTNELRLLRDRCPDTPALLLSSLAEGADQLCARTALEEGWIISAVLPLPLEEYEKDFRGESRKELRSLLSECRDVFVVPERGKRLAEQSDIGMTYRDRRYLEAGMYVADHCHALLALWDGSAGAPDGCGTAEVAEYMLHQKESVLQIVTRRAGSTAKGQTADAGPDTEAATDAGAASCRTIWHGNTDVLDDILRRTDSFNKDVSNFETDGSAEGGTPVAHSSLPDGEAIPKDPVSRRISAVYITADLMSVKNAVKHKRSIAALSITATALTLAFLLYDEAFLFWMILLCLFLLGSLLLINRISVRLGLHKRYLEYRILAEALRVQGYLHTAGMRTEAAELLPWAVRQDLPWIRTALSALTIGETRNLPASIRNVWILDQKHYHEEALVRTEAKAKSNHHIVLTALIFMAATYIATALFEIILGGLFSGNPALTPEQLEFWRMILKILMGTLSAATLFAGNYYGSLSLEETAADHRRMIELYARADEEILTRGEDQNLLIELAKEELNENSRWFAYQSMNKPGVAL